MLTSVQMRWYYRRLGGHVHVPVFAGPPGYTLAKAGYLIFRAEEWQAVSERMERVDVEIVYEGEVAGAV